MAHNGVESYTDFPRRCIFAVEFQISSALDDG